MLVPTTPGDPASVANRKAWETLRSWTKPFLTAFSDQDAITRGGDRVFQRDVPGCAGQPHTTIEGGGHFLQEDKGAELARVIVDWLAGPTA
jgi:haloalkane dehalogenase